MKDFNH